MSNKTVYLVVHDMNGTLDATTIAMINYRNSNTEGLVDYVPFTDGTEDTEETTYQMLRNRYEGYKPIKGAGGDRTRDGGPYWVLPFWTAEGMPDPKPEYAVVLSATELREFGWDVVDVDI